MAAAWRMLSAAKNNNQHNGAIAYNIKIARNNQQGKSSVNAHIINQAS